MALLKGNTSQGQEIAKREQAADAPFLGASFWQKGAAITCEILSVHKSSNGPYVAARLISPEVVEVYDKEGNLAEHSIIRLGNLAGISFARKAALAEQKNPYFVAGDTVYLVCTGIEKATKEGYSDSPNFEIGIDPSPARKEKAA
jgi:hypothetical protein